MNGTDVDIIVFFLPNVSRATPPERAPRSAARGIRDPIQEAWSSVTPSVPDDWREAMAGDDQAELNPTIRDPREAARVGLKGVSHYVHHKKPKPIPH